jgi:hypothetical protein
MELLTGREWTLLILVPALSTLVGAVISFLLGLRHLAATRRTAFVEQQLAGLYSPLVGCRRRIRTLSEIRLKVHGASNAQWTDHVSSQKGRVMTDLDEQFQPFAKTIDYTNEQFKNELMPLYRRMLQHFTESFWLADHDTREFYSAFMNLSNYGKEIWLVPLHLVSRSGSDMTKKSSNRSTSTLRSGSGNSKIRWLTESRRGHGCPSLAPRLADSPLQPKATTPLSVPVRYSLAWGCCG